MPVRRLARNRPGGASRGPESKDPADGRVPGVRDVGCGEGIRTLDLRVMSPTSCRCSTPPADGSRRDRFGQTFGGRRRASRLVSTRGPTRLRYHPRDATSWTDRRMTRLPGRALLLDAHAHGFAVPAFNVSNLETIQGVLAAAELAAAPVILQLSPGAIAYAGYAPLTRLVMDLAGAAAVPVVVHLDHCREPDVVARAVDDGFDSVMFDGSRLAFDDNVAATCRLVALARAKDPGIAVEAELGLIGGREDTTPEAALAGRTTPGRGRPVRGRHRHRRPRAQPRQPPSHARRQHGARPRADPRPSPPPRTGRSPCTAARASTRRSSARRSRRGSARSTSRRA